MVDETTTGRGYQKPHPSNQLSEDVGRLRASADKIDTDMVAVFSALAGKAATVHVHAISDITGLSSALSGKSDTGHSHPLGGLSDVSLTGAASGQFLRFGGTVWSAAAIGISDVANLSTTLASMQSAINTMDDGTY